MATAKGASVIDGHRLYLYRIWDPGKPFIMFIGLNPSTADATKDDPTIRRISSMAKGWGYGGFYMMNLFTQIATNPRDLNIKTGNHISANLYLNVMKRRCIKVVFAWGNHKVNGRDLQVIEMFPDAYALYINKNGSPKHPLYCRADIQLIKFIK